MSEASGGGDYSASAYVAIIVLVVIMVLYATEVIPMPITAMFGALAMAILGVIDFKSEFNGFANDSLMMVAGMLIIGRTVFETGLVDRLGAVLKKVVGRGERSSIVSFQAATAAFSGFISDTTMTALMLPIAEATEKATNKRGLKRLLFMPIGAAAVFGGNLTLVGSVPQVMANGFLADGGYQTMEFFTMTPAALPLLAIGILYFATIGYHQLKSVPIRDDDTYAREEALQLEAAPNHTPKNQAITAVVFVICVIGFVTGTWTLGTISILGALVLIVTGCIGLRSVVNNIDWGPVIILGGSLGFSAGLAASGGGELIANTIIGLCGGEAANPHLIFAMIVVISAVLANVMAHTATTAMMVPIGLFLAQAMGLNPIAICIGIVFAGNFTMITPIATVPITLTLSGGYRFFDYIRVGGPLSVVMIIAIIIIVPLVYGL